ncbi:MAG: hypothetical protein LBS21_01475 [Clostridiales bacterium]|nr:hypothetical protein [Clostridiales bacterium]
MKDILLTADGDLNVNEWGDIILTDSVRQAVRVRLLWFFSEWRFAPEYGVPYFEEILIKKPNLEGIKQIVRKEAMSVNEVTDVKNITLSFDKPSRQAGIFFDLVVGDETYREEVLIDAGLRNNT